VVPRTPLADDRALRLASKAPASHPGGVALRRFVGLEVLPIRRSGKNRPQAASPCRIPSALGRVLCVGVGRRRRRWAPVGQPLERLTADVRDGVPKKRAFARSAGPRFARPSPGRHPFCPWPFEFPCEGAAIAPLPTSPARAFRPASALVSPSLGRLLRGSASQKTEPGQVRIRPVRSSVVLVRDHNRPPVVAADRLASLGYLRRSSTCGSDEGSRLVSGPPALDPCDHERTDEPRTGRADLLSRRVRCGSTNCRRAANLREPPSVRLLLAKAVGRTIAARPASCHPARFGSCAQLEERLGLGKRLAAITNGVTRDGVGRAHNVRVWLGWRAATSRARRWRLPRPRLDWADGLSG